MLILRGPPALSEFRLQKLTQRLQASLGTGVDLYAEYMHFAELDQALSDEEQIVLQQILSYGPRRVEQEPNGLLLLAVPRPGTLSPWSTKATDIVHHCGLGAIKRLERGVAYYINRDTELSDDELNTAMALLHDRMTEVVLIEMEDAS